MYKSKLIVSICIVVILIGVIFIFRSLENTGRVTENQELFNFKSKGHIKGRIQIEVFSDFQCKICAWGIEVLNDYLESYPKDIYVTYYNFLFSSHRYTLKLAIYGECAAKQGQFWLLHDTFFRQQKRLEKSKNIEKDLKEIVETIGVNIEKFYLCVNDKNTELAIQKEKREGKSRGVKSTPTYFVNGKMIVGLPAFIEEMYKYFKEPDNEKP